MPKIVLSIIILNYKTKHLLRLAMKNLLELGITIPFEVIVVDNASMDGSVEMIERFYPAVQLIKNQHNLGHAAGNNQGIKAAQGEYLLFMNSDIIFFQAADLIKLVEYMQQYPKVGALGPKLINGDGSIQYSCFRPYTWLTPLYRRTPLGRSPAGQRDLQRHLMVDFDHSTIKEVDWLLGAVLLTSKTVLQQCGTFDERFFLYFADFELCDRIKAHQYKVLYYPEVTIVHYHRRESATGSIWGGVGSLLNYTTRVHLSDWFKYRTITYQGYGTHS